MLGILGLAILYIWLLIGNSRSFIFKAILSALILGSYVFFLQTQGAKRDEILEILFSFDF